MATTTAPPVDLILIFQSSSASRTEAQNAEADYSALLAELRNGGLDAVGKVGSKKDEILILIRCPWNKIRELTDNERQTDFLHGVSAASLPSLSDSYDKAPLTPADRLRLLHTYITSAQVDGGLGIAPGVPRWSRLTGVMALKDHQFEAGWLKSWTTRRLGVWMGDGELSRIKDQYGEAVALYFAFLSSYAHALVLPALLGLSFFLLGITYSPIYAVPLMLWSITFVELFRLRERTLAVRWGTRGAGKVERRRAEFRGTISPEGEESFPWYAREIRMLVSVPVIITEGAILGAVLTAIFVFEAFVTQIYTGPFANYAGYIPTVLFLTFIPKLLALYQSSAKALTGWENHAHQSTYASSLQLKTFALSSIVAYLGLFLTAFVYIPFGADVMRFVYTRVLSLRLPAQTPSTPSEVLASAAAAANGTTTGPKVAQKFTTLSDAESKIRPDRLHNQMFAYTVTNQAVNFGLEIGLPYVTKAVADYMAGKGIDGKKGLVKENEKGLASGEKSLLERAREEAALPDYELFGDFSEMVTQFGYVVLWSVAWPLAPVAAVVNNWVELRSDAFKIVTHVRRPIPMRTDTIGPWLEAMGFMCWLGSLTNAALIYLFHPTNSSPDPAGSPHSSPMGSPFLTTSLQHANLPSSTTTIITTLLPAALLALSASHGYILARAVARHLLERALWKGSAAEAGERKREIEVRSLWAKRAKAMAGGPNVAGVGRELAEPAPVGGEAEGGEKEQWTSFWQDDEALAEIQKAIKTA